MGVFGSNFLEDDVVLDAISFLKGGEDFNSWLGSMIDNLNSDSYIEYDYGAEFILLLQIYMYTKHEVIPIYALEDVPLQSSVQIKDIESQKMIGAIAKLKSEESEYFELREELFEDSLNEYLDKVLEKL